MGQGRRVTDAQVKELRRSFQQGASLRTAAMKAGMDRKTGRKYRAADQLPSASRAARNWRTRPDPLAAVWARVEEQLQREPRLQAKTLLAWLQREVPTQDWEPNRRTLERRVRQWKAEHGPAKEVFFSQVHEPGRLGASDFTHMESLAVTLEGQPFGHLLYHFVLTHSNWEHVSLCFSESFASLSEGMQNALWELGGVPRRHRTDRMTLAVNHEGNGERYTARYQALLHHYGLEAEATNPASGHENGDCEQGHRRLKEALEQALLLRGSRDFASRGAYWQFVQAVVAQRNAARGGRVRAELAQLQPLPACRLETQEQARVRVSRSSTIRVKGNIYSVPARLIGEMVQVRIGAETMTVWYAGTQVQTMERLRGTGKHRINYRDISSWLVRKPGAFARYVYREDLYPSVTYRRSYDALVAQQAGRADKEYVRLLQLATEEGEARVEEALAKLLEQHWPLSEQAVRTLLGKDTALSVAARVQVPAVDLRQYDALLEGQETTVSDSGMSVESQERDPSSDSGMSVESQEQEHNDDQGCVAGAGSVPARTASAGGQEAVRGGGPASECGDVELPGLSARADGRRMPAAAAAPHRAAVAGVEAAVGEELVDAGPEAPAAQGGAAVASAGERGLCRSPRERAGLRSTGFGEDARLGGGGARTGASWPAGVVHDVQLAGAGPAGGQARLDAEGVVETASAVGGDSAGRPWLRAAEPRGDGGPIHAAGGALRAGQRAGDEQPAVLEVGASLQGPDDGSGGDRQASASQCDHGTERVELPCGGGEAQQVQCGAGAAVAGGVSRPDNEEQAGWGPGSAPVAVASAPAPSAPPGPHPARFCTNRRGRLIVADGEG
jgi:hypothetical protein